MTKLSGVRYEHAKAIYDDLVRARGDQRYPAPPFMMSMSMSHGAYLGPGSNSIVLEQEAYDICMSLGEEEGTAAVAGLLGHELIHYYEKHQWRSSFVSEYQNKLQVGRSLESQVDLDKLNNETQADYLGGFLAYSAGYRVFHQRPALLDSIYRVYKIPEIDSSGRYPSLADRKKLAEISEEKLAQMVQLFEIANLMAAIGEYPNARAIYRHILTDYQSPQLFSNLGAVAVLEALETFPRSERIYRLPIELDLSFGAGSKDGFTEAERKEANKLLKEAIMYFNNALAMNNDYAPAYLNKACAYYLMEEWPQARFYAEVEAQSRTEAYPKTAEDANVLLALIALKNGEGKEAAIGMLSPLAEKSAIARYNLSKIKDENLPEGRNNEPWSSDIDGIDPIDLTGYGSIADNDPVLRLRLYGKLRIEAWELNNSTVIRVDPPKSGNGVYIHLTKKGSEEETDDGFRAGSPRADLIAKYGEPPVSRALPGGEVLVYGEVIFFLDKGGKLERWANYAFK